jgi:hypothetical protein
MRRVLLASLLVAAAAASVSAAVAGALAAHPADDGAASALRNGLHGTVFRGPTTPVCTVNHPCEAPAAGLTLTFSRPGAAPTRTKTNEDGKYRVLLPAAIYTVSTRPSGPERATAPFPRRVKVRRGHVDKLDFHIDTGIR